MELSDVFGAQTVGDLAGPRVYPRGATYHSDGRVEIKSRSSHRLTAKVRGTVPYFVEIWVDRGEPGWSCSCPYAEDGLFCKHCVAVSLTLMSDESTHFSLVSELVELPHAGDLTGHLQGLPRQRLVEIVLEQCEADWALRARLDAAARAARGDGPDLAAWKSRIDSAFSPIGDFVDYREAQGWASGIHDVLDGVEMLLSAGHDDAAIVLSEHAHRCNEAAIEYVDDSDGSITDIESRIGAMHLAACQSVRPDPIALARQLADLELTSELDGFHRAAESYAGVLGESGIEEYRRILSPQWDAVKGSENERSSGRFRVEQAMIGVALGSRNPDALIEVIGEGTLYPHDYLEIAVALADTGRHDDAIDWARRGLAEWPSRPMQLSELRALLAELLHDQGESGAAVELYWDAFLAMPSLSSYRDLLAQVGPDSDRWARRCTELLSTRTAEESHEDDEARPWFVPSPSQALIEILMYEGNIDAAWDTAIEHGASDGTWGSLARAREATHPLDSIGVYEREVFAQIDKKKRRDYESAVRLLARIEQVGDRAGEPERFRALMERVRAEHRPKWSFMEMLDRNGW
ncbi:MAG: SWIM zinc finger family protein [Acidimicrobiia bacterium]